MWELATAALEVVVHVLSCSVCTIRVQSPVPRPERSGRVLPASDLSQSRAGAPQQPRIGGAERQVVGIGRPALTICPVPSIILSRCRRPELAAARRHSGPGHCPHPGRAPAEPPAPGAYATSAFARLSVSPALHRSGRRTRQLTVSQNSNVETLLPQRGTAPEALRSGWRGRPAERDPSA